MSLVHLNAGLMSPGVSGSNDDGCCSTYLLTFHFNNIVIIDNYISLVIMQCKVGCHSIQQ